MSNDKSRPGFVDPYQALAEYGATENGTMAEIHRAGMAAQRAGALTPDRNLAWRQLRDARKRLVVDLFRLQLDPTSFGRSLLKIPQNMALIEEIAHVDPSDDEVIQCPDTFLEEPE